METHEKLKKEVKNLIGDNKTGKALKLLTSKSLPRFDKEIILLNSRFSKATDEQRLGISDNDDIQRKFNKINFDLLALVELIGTKQELGVSRTGTGDGGAKNNTQKYLLYLGGLVLAIAAAWGIMQMTGNSESKLSGAKTENTSTKKPEDKIEVKNLSESSTSQQTPPPPSTTASVPEKKLALGMVHDGGKIFYLDESGKHGLIMAPIDMPEGEIYWLNNDGPIQKAGATASALYAGRLNTKDLIDLHGDGDYPAQLCVKYSRRGFSDWYLPSQMELDKLYEYSLSHPNELSKSYYWSSTEISDSKKDVYYRNFRNGEKYVRLPFQNSYTNQNKARVRAIRSF